MDVSTCPDECGTWVNATVAPIAFQPDEIAENRITRWWRVREPCPVCKEQMLLRGSQDHELFQGCTKHGYWIDVDTVGETSLARPGLLARLKKVRDEEDARKSALEAEKRAAALRATQEKEDREREAERQRQERELEAARLREEGRREAQRKQDEKQRKLDEKKRQDEEKQRRKEQVRRDKADAKRRAKELEEQLLQERRVRLLAAVKTAMAADDPEPIVSEILKLESRVVELVNRVTYLERHTVKFEREDKDD